MNAGAGVIAGKTGEVIAATLTGRRGTEGKPCVGIERGCARHITEVELIDEGIELGAEADKN